MIKQILVVDVEATCEEKRMPDFVSEIIEIGVTTVNIADKSIGHSMAIIVQPEISKVTPFCTKLTTLTAEFVKQHGMPFFGAANLLRTTFDSQNSVWASYGDYDRNMFEMQCRRMGVRYPFSKWHLNVKSLLVAKYGRSGSMDEMSKTLGIEHQGTLHRGVDDSLTIAKMLVKLLSS